MISANDYPKGGRRSFEGASFRLQLKPRRNLISKNLDVGGGVKDVQFFNGLKEKIMREENKERGMSLSNGGRIKISASDSLKKRRHGGGVQGEGRRSGGTRRPESERGGGPREELNCLKSRTL